MLNKLRVIEWPHEIMPVGHLIDGQMLGLVSDYESLINQAKTNAEKIREEARRESIVIVEETRVKEAERIRKDINFSYRKRIFKNDEKII
jgi:F0F1-type ATP synthase membrane subunit b/b'